MIHIHHPSSLECILQAHPQRLLRDTPRTRRVPVPSAEERKEEERRKKGRKRPNLIVKAYTAKDKQPDNCPNRWPCLTAASSRIQYGLPCNRAKYRSSTESDKTAAPGLGLCNCMSEKEKGSYPLHQDPRETPRWVSACCARGSECLNCGFMRRNSSSLLVESVTVVECSE